MTMRSCTEKKVYVERNISPIFAHTQPVVMCLKAVCVCVRVALFSTCEVRL